MLSTGYERVVTNSPRMITPKMTTPEKLIPAKIEWRGNQPFALDYDDIYFSPDAEREVERVFLEPSRLLARAKEQPRLCVVELGFGTGLNFAVTAHAVVTQTQSRLHFISFEKHPLSPTDWDNVHKQIPAHLSLYLTQQLSVLPGWHRRVYAQGRVTLSVYYGTALDGLKNLTQQQQPVDVWYLDGFAPDRNPSLWANDLLSYLPDLSAPDATAVTFSAASRVKRALQAQQFEVQKVNQRPLKQESIAAKFCGLGKAPFTPPQQVQVLGAGIAGAMTARQLAEQGIEVSIDDPAGIAKGASSIGAAVLHARLLGDQSSQADWRVSAYHFASQYVKNYRGVYITGVQQITGPNLSLDKLNRIARVYQANRSHNRWISCQDNSLWFPDAGYIDLPLLCEDLLDHPLITWDQTPSEDIPRIVCCGSATRGVANANWLEMVDVWGQLDWIEASNTLVGHPIVGDGYIVPGHNDRQFAIGASYEYRPWQPDEARKHNEELNTRWLAHCSDWQWLHNQRGARCIASDRTAIVGRLSSASNIWVNTAHGSMGTTSAPTAAAIVCSDLLGWIPPVTESVTALLEPERFKRRQAKRGVRLVELDHLLG